MTRRDIALLVGGLVALTAIGYLAGIVVTRVFDGFFVERIDRPAIDWLAEHRTESWNSVMKAATRLGAGVVVTALTVAAALGAYLTSGDLRWSGFFVLAGLGGTWFDKILKPLVGRERPDFDRLIDIGGHSFPSGHATAITALWLALAVYASRRWGSRAAWVSALSGAVILLVLVTRPYLGVHYPTDVIAGAALSALWVPVCLSVSRPPAPGGSRNTGDILLADSR